MLDQLLFFTLDSAQFKLRGLLRMEQNSRHREFIGKAAPILRIQHFHYYSMTIEREKRDSERKITN